MIVDVIVIAPMIVAALVNWNDTVIVIDSVIDSASENATRGQKRLIARACRPPDKASRQCQD